MYVNRNLKMSQWEHQSIKISLPQSSLLLGLFLRYFRNLFLDEVESSDSGSIPSMLRRRGSERFGQLRKCGQLEHQRQTEIT